MSRARRRAEARGGRQRGGVLVMTALMLPLLIAFCGFVVDVGNWFLHKRHLQTQADAAALAAAGEFHVPCSNDAILAMAAKYATVDDADGYNPQVGDTPLDELWQETNSETWYDQDSPVDDSVVTGQPCDAKMIDVKLTETNLPWWLKAAHVPFINAHARVEIRKKKRTTGALPVAVPEVGPKNARAIFVNETTGAVIDSVALQRTPDADEDNGGLAIWSNVDAPKSVAINTAHIGIRIVLSASSSVTCTDPLVACFGAGTQDAIVAGQPGLAHIRGWSNATAATTTAPVLKDVDMVPVGCEDGYFTAIAGAYPCTVDVNAVVDFAGAPLAGIRVYAKKTGVANNANNLAPLRPPSSAGQPWVGGGFSINAASAGNSFSLVWRSGCNPDRTVSCNTTVNNLEAGAAVQRTFAGSSALTVSGPIKLLKVSDSGGPGANTFQRCSTCTQSLVVSIGLPTSLENAASVDDPPVSLKVAGGGSQNQALDCDPDPTTNLQDELASGCGANYVPNAGTSCPATAPDLYNTDPPWDCVPNNTGASVGQVTHGLNLRILGGANETDCTSPNNWEDFPNFSPSDPRIVEVFIVPFGSFTGSGQEVVPVSGFATFYITGWDGGACQGDGDDNAGQGEVVGHFIKYIDRLNEGEAGEEFCDFAGFGSCVAVLTR